MTETTDDGFPVCGSNECNNLANMHVFWPGRPPLTMCAACALAAKKVAAITGCHVHVEPIDFRKLAIGE